MNERKEKKNVRKLQANNNKEMDASEPVSCPKNLLMPLNFIKEVDLVLKIKYNSNIDDIYLSNSENQRL